MYSGSAIVDLKAELSRKEDELCKAKDTKQSSFKGSKTFAKIQQLAGKRKKKNKKKERDKYEKEDDEKEGIPDETLQLLEKARHKLEAKAKIYEKMQKGEMEDVENVHGETRYLVDFQHKYYTEVDDEEEWLNKTPLESPSSSFFEVNELHRETMREKWEKEQDEMLEGPVHYEHVKFDEVRNLGTGYFAFSKDEQERKKQLDELKDLREETKSAQNKKELLLQKRKSALEERLDKVKRRKLGNIISDMETEKCPLPNNSDPIEISNNDLDTNKNIPSSSEISEKVYEACGKGNDSPECSLLSEEDEKILHSCRKSSQTEREWDKGKKSGFMNQIFVKAKKPHLYEQRMEERRDERDDEFGPPNSY